MSAPARLHTGLPFVPQPVIDELLGSWLLRVAECYGLGLNALLSRLGARPTGVARMRHWFSIDGSTVSLDSLSAAMRLSRADLAAMAPADCRPLWPEELGACATCLEAAAKAGRPSTWSLPWMNPLATVCSIHGTWLTPVATRTLTSVRHAADLGGVVQQIAAAQRPDDEPAYARDALWLQDLCAARTYAHPAWEGTRPRDLIRIVDAVAREVIAATESSAAPLGLLADRTQGCVKSFAFEVCNGERVSVTLPMRLRQRQKLLATVSHVLRWPSAQRTCFSTWSTVSIKRLALMRDWPDGTIAWICPPAADLVRRQDALRREFSISPRYFKASAALIASLK